MKKFIVTYHAPASAAKQTAKLSKAEQAKGMAAWMTWAQKCGNQLVDMGSPLTNSEALSPKGSKKSNKNFAGYSVLQAKNMAEAKKLLKGHPHLGWNAACTIEVHETAAIPGM